MAITVGAQDTYSSDLVDLDNYAVRKAVSEELYYEYGRAHILGDGDVPGLSSYNGDSIIHVKQELEAGPGQTVGFELIRNIGGPGVSGDTELENREVDIEHADCRIAIYQHRQGAKSGGRETRQSLTWDWLSNALPLLAKHAKTMDEIGVLAQLAGANASDSQSYYKDDGGIAIDLSDSTNIWSGMNPVLAPDADHHIWCSVDHSTDETLDSTDYLDRTYVLEAVYRNTQLLNPIRPVNVGGSECFVLFINSNVGRRIKENDTDWFALMKAGLEGSPKDFWPAFESRIIGKFENVLLVESPFVPPGVNSSTQVLVDNTWRNVLCGAQAIGRAYGRENEGGRLGVYHGNRDHGNIHYVSYFRLHGFQKTQFKDRSGTARDHGTMVLSSYATRPTVSS